MRNTHYTLIQFMYIPECIIIIIIIITNPILVCVRLYVYTGIRVINTYTVSVYTDT